MTDEDKLKNLRARISAAQQEEARASVARDNAVKNREAAVADLEKHFGVNTVEEAEALLVKFKQELAAEIASAEDKLAEIGA